MYQEQLPGVGFYPSRTQYYITRFFLLGSTGHGTVTITLHERFFSPICQATLCYAIQCCKIGHVNTSSRLISNIIFGMFMSGGIGSVRNLADSLR